MSQQTEVNQGFKSLKKQLKKLGSSIQLPYQSLEKLNFVAKTKGVIEEVSKFFGSILTIPGEFGKGALTYVGFWNETYTVFLGKSSKGKDYILHFNSEEGEKEAEKFRSNFLDLEENAELVKEIYISSAEILYLVDSKDGMRTEKDFEDRLGEAISGQQQSLPKVSGEKGKKIIIGGKTSSQNIMIEYHSSSAGSIEKVMVTINLSGDSAKKFDAFLRESINATIQDVGAFAIISLLDKVTLTTILQVLKDYFSKAYQVGQVAMYAQAKQRKTTTHGKSVLKALKSIENKMKASAKEAHYHILGWVEDLVNNRDEFKDSHDFLNKLRDILAKNPNYQPIVEQVKYQKTLAEVLDLTDSEQSSDDDGFDEPEPSTQLVEVQPQISRSRTLTYGVSAKDAGSTKIYKVGNLQVTKEEYESLPQPEKPYDQMNPNEKGSYTNKMRNLILTRRRKTEGMQDDSQRSTEVVIEDEEESLDSSSSSITITSPSLGDDSLTMEEKSALALKQIIEFDSNNDPTLMVLHEEFYKNKGPKPNKGWKPDYPITLREDAVIQGCLYADATLGLGNSGSGRLRIAQGTKQLQYVIWKFMELKRLCTFNKPPTYREVTNYETGGLKKTFEFYLNRGSYLKIYHDLFYKQQGTTPKGNPKYEKTITKELVAVMPKDPVFLAMIMLDDGSVRNDAYSGKIAFQCFTKTKEGLQLFVEKVKELFDVQLNIVTSTVESGQFYLSIPAAEFGKFVDLIEPTISQIPDLAYKLNADRRELSKFLNSMGQKGSKASSKTSTLTPTQASSDMEVVDQPGVDEQPEPIIEEKVSKFKM
uniref:Homing endonuclease LAGLIDADG domain-containing protein n=1 Tax=Pseudopediastrum boryanum TaxID=55410 RepID=A0A2U8GJ52_PSEBY|nr:hypothetical protein [Pseudopediastrum boryanum]AWI68695.1 hypothetical protein [Pseudopediastrum boryanum]